MLHFHRSSDLFISTETSDRYGQLSDRVVRFYPLDRTCNPLVANMILYHHSDETGHVVEKQKVEIFLEKANELLKLGKNCCHVLRPRDVTQTVLSN